MSTDYKCFQEVSAHKLFDRRSHLAMMADMISRRVP
jgi:hypothetical protein